MPGLWRIITAKPLGKLATSIVFLLNLFSLRFNIAKIMISVGFDVYNVTCCKLQIINEYNQGRDLTSEL